MPDNRTATVMLVDDEVMVATALRSFLELETAWCVLTFSDPLQALEALRSEHADVIVSDFMMPGIDGVTFLRQSREIQPLATRILLTGYGDKTNAIRAINEAGLYYYLQKPWDNEQLRMVIRNGIERATLFRELDERVGELDGAHSELQQLRRKLIRTFL